MPRELKIKDGPSFRSFVFMSPVFSDSEWLMSFTVDGEVEDKIIDQDKKHEFTSKILFIGRVLSLQNQRNREVDAENYSFIAVREGCSTYKVSPFRSKRRMFYYVGFYNTRTRKGTCFEFLEHEFFASKVVGALWGRGFTVVDSGPTTPEDADFRQSCEDRAS